QEVLVVWHITSSVHVVSEVTRLTSNLIHHITLTYIQTFLHCIIIMSQVRGHHVEVFTSIKTNLTTEGDGCCSHLPCSTTIGHTKVHTIRQVYQCTSY